MVPVSYWIWLQYCLSQGNDLISDILEAYGDPKKFFEAVSECDLATGLIPLPKISRAILDKCKKTPLTVADPILENCEKTGCDILCYDNEEYPNRLRNIFAPPAVLYKKGTLSGLDEIPAITMVGTRRMTNYGRAAAIDFGRELAKAGICVVSGMALGIDIISMKAALKEGGYVIGVLGCGIDINYPVENTQMKELTGKYGCILTEYPPTTGVRRGHFPVRNRLLAGLSLGTLVIQAPVHSGTLITVDYALEQGKDLFVIPGPLYDESVGGNLRLLRDGCMPVTSPSDVIDVYRFQYQEVLEKEQKRNQERRRGKASSVLERENVVLKERESFQAHKDTQGKQTSKSKITSLNLKTTEPKVSPQALDIYHLLGKEPMHMEEISVQTGLRISQVLAALTELEVSGFAKAYSGRRYGKQEGSQ